MTPASFPNSVLVELTSVSLEIMLNTSCNKIAKVGNNIKGKRMNEAADSSERLWYYLCWISSADLNVYCTECASWSIRATLYQIAGVNIQNTEAVATGEGIITAK